MGTTSATISPSSCPAPCYPSSEHKLSPSWRTGFPRAPRLVPCPQLPLLCMGSTLPSSGVCCTQGAATSVRWDLSFLDCVQLLCLRPGLSEAGRRFLPRPAATQPAPSQSLASVSYSAGCATTCFESHLICLMKQSAVFFPENVF